MCVCGSEKFSSLSGSTNIQEHVIKRGRERERRRNARVYAPVIMKVRRGGERREANLPFINGRAGKNWTNNERIRMRHTCCSYQIIITGTSREPMALIFNH